MTAAATEEVMEVMEVEKDLEEDLEEVKVEVVFSCK